MDEKNFSEQILDAIKANAFEIKKILLNLDDCVPKSDFVDALEKLHQTELEVERLKKNRTRLENEIDNKTSEITDLLRQHTDLSDKVYNQREELERRQNSLKKAQDKISRLETELEEKNSRLAEYNKNYSDLEQAIAAYKNLSDETKFSLEGIFGRENSPMSFLAGVLQPGHLESLFEFVAITMNNGINGETEILSKLFDFGFNAVNSGRREKIFTRLNVQVGDDFSNSTMRKTSDSPQLGTVKKILLDGYKYVRTNKIVKPSLVSLG